LSAPFARSRDLQSRPECHASFDISNLDFERLSPGDAIGLGPPIAGVIANVTGIQSKDISTTVDPRTGGTVSVSKSHASAAKVEAYLHYPVASVAYVAAGALRSEDFATRLVAKIRQHVEESWAITGPMSVCDPTISGCGDSVRPQAKGTCKGSDPLASSTPVNQPPEFQMPKMPKVHVNVPWDQLGIVLAVVLCCVVLCAAVYFCIQSQKRRQRSYSRADGYAQAEQVRLHHDNDLAKNYERGCGGRDCSLWWSG